MIYLDNAATSFPKAPGVAQAVFDFLQTSGANAGRSSYPSAQNSSLILFETRELLAKLFQLDNSERILFTNNATQALNTIIFGLAEKGTIVLTSSMEHNSVMRPLQFLQRKKKINLTFFHCDSFGFPDLADYEKHLQKKPKFVITTACSNVTGAIFPFLKMANLARKYKVIFCLDAAQLVGDFPIDLSGGLIDALCFSGHKGLLGPTGTGGFFLRENVAISPFLLGGTGSSSDLEIQPDFLPDKFESGTQNIAGIAGLKCALELILNETVEKIFEKKQFLFRYFYEQMESLEQFQFFSPTVNQIGILSVIPKFCSISAFTQQLNAKNIAIRMGLHCAPRAHQTIGTFPQGGTIRFSPGYFTTKQDLEKTLAAIQEIIRDEQ